MRLPGFLQRQIAQPQGWVGGLVAAVMNQDTAAEVQGTVARLLVQRDGRVLDVGFGGGTSIDLLLGAAPEGRVAGIETSDRCVEVVRTAQATAVEAGRLDLRVGRGEELPWLGGSFDGVMTVHTLAFVAKPKAILSEMKRVLRPGGRLVVGLYAPPVMIERGFEPGTFTPIDGPQVAAILDDLGVREAKVETVGRATFVLGRL